MPPCQVLQWSMHSLCASGQAHSTCSGHHCWCVVVLHVCTLKHDHDSGYWITWPTYPLIQHCRLTRLSFQLQVSPLGLEQYIGLWAIVIIHGCLARCSGEVAIWTQGEGCCWVWEGWRDANSTQKGSDNASKLCCHWSDFAVFHHLKLHFSFWLLLLANIHERKRLGWDLNLNVQNLLVATQAHRPSKENKVSIVKHRSHEDSSTKVYIKCIL